MQDTRTRARARRRTGIRRRLLLGLWVCVLGLSPAVPSAGGADAEDPSGGGKNTERFLGEESQPGAKSEETLSDRLSKNKGVIEPPQVGDEGIHTQAPEPDPGTTRVIPPPGTPGGDQKVQPK